MPANGPHIYYLDSFKYAWLFPLGEVAGIAAQIWAIGRRNKKLLFGAMSLVIFCALMERDITLITGNLLATVAVYYLISRGKDKS